MGVLDRLRRLVSRKLSPEPGAAEPVKQGRQEQDAEPQRLGPAPATLPPASTLGEAPLPEEQRLLELLEAAAGGGAVSMEPQRVLAQVAAISRAGREPVAVDLLRRLTARFPESYELRMGLARSLYDQGHEADAARLLERLVDHPEVALDAHFLLGEFHEREAEPDQALRHYEAVMAVDFEYPKARRRADALRRKLAVPAAGMAAPTLLGADDLGPGARFMLQRELGRGGGGAVYLARDRALGRQVAVKVLHPHVASRAGAREHLFCEARIATSLRHPQIVFIYDLDEALNMVVMEYCAGGALGDIIPLVPARALARLAEIAGVLDTVHRCGVIHRDLKPSNLLLRRSSAADSPLVLTDFGIAHAVEAGSDAPEVGGSLAYMAPEQRRGEARADPRADLYSCGVVLLEMLLGSAPLSHQDVIQGAVLLEARDVWRQVREMLPGRPGEELTVLARGLVHPDPERRPSAAEEVERRAMTLVEQVHRLRDRQAVKEDLRRRAGRDRSDAQRRWLSDPWV